MIIKSYLVYPVSGQRNSLIEALKQLPGCDINPAINQELVVLVTESADDLAEAALETQIHAIPSLQALALVSGHNELARPQSIKKDTA